MTEPSAQVDHYGSQYGNFETDLYAQIRSETYDEDIGQNGWLTAAEQDLFVKWLDLGPDSRLLDVACGSGGPTLRIATLTGCSVAGVDIHDDGIRNAQHIAKERGLVEQATFQQADGATRLPFADTTFDAVMCIDAINHLPDRERVLTEWHRVLKPGGRLLFTDPIIVTGPLTDKEIAIRASIGFFLFVPDGTDDRMLKSAGFEILRRENRTSNMADVAERWRHARGRRENDLRRAEGDADFDGQQLFFSVCAKLANERRLSRIAYCARRV
ncbi:MAG: class I SAM-dependent methyltransferase [Rhodothermia bacterium]|nr:class I SAM-dependent methyltransferase [Rhodothermia bacterium]